MKTLLCFSYFPLYFIAHLCVLPRPFIHLSPLPAAASTHLQSMVEGSSQALLKSFQTLFISQDPGGLSCLLDSHLGQARSDVWVAVDMKLYNLFHQVGGGKKPQLGLSELSRSYSALKKHQLPYLHLENSCCRSRKQAGGIFSPAVVAQKLQHLPEM